MCTVTPIPTRTPRGDTRDRKLMYRNTDLFFIPVVVISIPTQKTMAALWIAMARNSFHTPDWDCSNPIAIPSKRLCMERARMTRKERREVSREEGDFPFPDLEGDTEEEEDGESESEEREVEETE